MKNEGLKSMFKSYDDIFQSSGSEQGEKVVEIPIKKLKSFKNHPFKIKNDDRFKELVESISIQGVMIPGVARPLSDGNYEIIAGHTRKKACEKLGIDSMPMIIKDVDDDTATVLMVDSNIQREVISISEKAKAYRMKFDAIKHQGFSGGNSYESLKEESGESERSIQRYVKLSYLTDDLLEMIDENFLGIRAGVELSFIKSRQELDDIYEVLLSEGHVLSISEAKELRKLSASIGLRKATILKTLGLANGKTDAKSDEGEKQEEKRKRPTKKGFKIDRSKITQYFDEEISDGEIEMIIIKLLDQWAKSNGKEVLANE